MRQLFYFLIIIVIAGMLLPENTQIPVNGASSSDFNDASFWAYPWGTSGTHKGIDIFAPEHTIVRPASGGLVLNTGYNDVGGNYALVLSAKWRLHYYAHLDSVYKPAFSWINKCDVLGEVGTTGNAAGKDPHLHYSILSIVPQPWMIDRENPEGWKKMFFIDPGEYLSKN